MGLTLDESKKDDKHYRVGALPFIMDPSVVETAQSFGSILVDYVDCFFGRGFRLSLTRAPVC